MALAHGEAVPHTSEIRPAQRWICARYRPRANNPSMCRTNLGSMWDRFSMGRLLDPKPLHAHTCICRDLSRSLNIFQNLSTSPEISQNLSKSLRISQNLSKSFKISPDPRFGCPEDGFQWKCLRDAIFSLRDFESF